MAEMKTWFEIQAKASSPEEADVFLYDEIGGWGVNAKSFIDAVRATGAKRINLRINSPGGSVFDGIAIYNFLRGLDVTVQIDGLAASISSIIALAGKTVRIAGNGFFMIHNPWGGVFGEADEMREAANLLDKIRESLVGTYASKTGKDYETIKKWMDSETWFSAAEAKEAGFVDEVTDEIAFAASAWSFQNAPEAIKSGSQKNISKPQPKPMNKLLQSLAAAGLISSADVAEDTAVTEFDINFANFKKAKADAQAALDEIAKAKVATIVDAAIADGRIAAAVKDAWIAQIQADAKAAELLAAIQAPKPGSDPVGSPAGAGGKTSADLRAEFDRITDPKARTAFWSQHKAQLLKK
jgi:ATP-dependent Clp endopeptidase proteolytic subunit ClpP